MRTRLGGCAAVAAAFVLASASTVGATVIDFTGGTVFFNGGGTGVTNNSTVFQNVDYYEEGGFRVDFSFNGAPSTFASIVGNYYGVGNDVIHSHWDTGDFGEVTEIRVSRIDGNPFDLNYFRPTSNTDTGGSTASGNERAFITSSNLNPMMLPPEDWGFPAVQISPLEFRQHHLLLVYVENAVDCFGMDNFFIDEEAPGALFRSPRT